MYCVYDFDLIGGGWGGGLWCGWGFVFKYLIENFRICLDCLFDILDLIL